MKKTNSEKVWRKFIKKYKGIIELILSNLFMFGLFFCPMLEKLPILDFIFMSAIAIVDILWIVKTIISK